MYVCVWGGGGGGLKSNGIAQGPIVPHLFGNHDIMVSCHLNVINASESGGVARSVESNSRSTPKRAIQQFFCEDSVMKHTLRLF